MVATICLLISCQPREAGLELGWFCDVKTLMSPTWRFAVHPFSVDLRGAKCCFDTFQMVSEISLSVCLPALFSSPILTTINEINYLTRFALYQNHIVPNAIGTRNLIAGLSDGHCSVSGGRKQVTPLSNGRVKIAPGVGFEPTRPRGPTACLVRFFVISRFNAQRIDTLRLCRRTWLGNPGYHDRMLATHKCRSLQQLSWPSCRSL